MTPPFAEPPANLCLSGPFLALLRNEKARLAAQTGRAWSLEQVLRAALLHWFAYPPAQPPTHDELQINV